MQEVSLSTHVPDPDRYLTGGLSDVGQVRTVNQDYCDEFFDPATGRRLLVLADGMGGHQGGEVASQIAVEAVGRAFQAGGDDAGELLRQALEEANRLVHEQARANPELAGMGTTTVCLLFEAGGRCWVAHVGDSRAYQLRDDKFAQITEDHSVVGALIRMGHITEEEARLHPQRNEILRAIGTNDEVEVQVDGFDVQPGDRYLLCSDGLSGMVPDEEIAQVLGAEPPDDAVRMLVEMANDEGGTDNITVQIAVIPGEAPSVNAAATESWDAGKAVAQVTEHHEEESGGLPVWAYAACAAAMVGLGWLLLR